MQEQDRQINFAISKYGAVSDKTVQQIAKAEDLWDTKGIHGMKAVAGSNVINICSEAVLTVPLHGREIWTTAVTKLRSGVVSLRSDFVPLYKMRSR